jgi:hypothetical protein
MLRILTRVLIGLLLIIHGFVPLGHRHHMGI